jgi:hypothetical protein
MMSIQCVPMLATSSFQASSRSGSMQVLVQVLGHLDGRFNNFNGNCDWLQTNIISIHF